MISSGRRALFPVFLLAALAALIAILTAMPWSAHAQSVPTLEIADVSASEGEGALEFTVGLAGGATSAQAVTVDYATADGDALAGNDYIGTTGTLTIPSGDSSGVVTVTVNNDGLREIDETFTLTLSNPSNAALPGGAVTVTVTGTILDDERPFVSMTSREDEVFQGQTAFFDITRTGSAEEDVLVSMNVKQVHLGDAPDSILYDAGRRDYGTKNYLIRGGEREIEVGIRPDDAIEGDSLMIMSLRADVDYRHRPEEVRVRQRPVHQSSDPSGSNDALPAVTIAAGSGGEGGVPTVAEGEEATFTLTRGGDTSEQLAVWVYTEEPHHPDWTPDDEENPSADFHTVIFPPRSGTATLTMAVEDDGVAEDADWLEAFVSPIEVSRFRRGNPHRAVVNIVDERVDHDSLSGLLKIGIVAKTSAVDEGWRIRVDTVQPQQSYETRFDGLNVKVRISQDGSSVPEDRVGIIASVHTKVAAANGRNHLRFPTLANDGDEPDTTVTFTLLESPEYRIDPDKASVTVNVRDQDPAPVLEIGPATAPKDAETIDFRVSFADDLPSLRTVTVDYRTEDGTAEAGQDYTETSGTLTIPAGETGGVISVPLLVNRFAVAGSKFKMHLEDPSNASLASSGPATATLGYRPSVQLAAPHLAIEAGETATFDLTRDGTPSSELTVRVLASENNGRGGDVEDRGHHYVTFAAGASTTVLGIEDVANISNPDHWLKVKIYPNSDLYENGYPDDAFVKVYDQLADVSIAVDHETVVEGDIGDGEGKDAIFTLTRTGDASEELKAMVRVDDPALIRCLDHTFWHRLCPDGPTFEEEVTFAADSATATLAVRIFNDWRDVPDDSAVTVTLIGGEDYWPGNPASASVTLQDDDFASHLELTARSYTIKEGAVPRFDIYRDDSEDDIAAYVEHVPWRISSTRPGEPFVEIQDVAEMAPGDVHYSRYVDVPEDNDKAERDWTYTLTILRIDGRIEPIPIEVEREQYYTAPGSRSVTVHVRDAGGPRVTIAADADGADITEGEAATFTLTRRGDTSEALTVGISVEDPGKFMRGNHLWADPQPPATVEFAAGSDTATLTLLTMDDWRDIPDGVLKVTIEPGNSRVYRPGNPASASVTVLDNDTRPVFELSADEETLTEGETVVFTVTRTADFTHDLGVVISVGIQGQRRSRTLSLTSEEPEATIEFATEDDDLDEADVVYEMVATVPYTDYTTVAEPHTITVTVRDDDLPRVGIEALSDSYNEGDYASFRLTREGQANSDLPIRVRLTQTGRVIRYFPEYTFGDRTIHIWETTRSQDIGFRISSNDGDEEDGAVDLELLPSDDYDIDPDKATDRFTVIDTDSAATLEAFAPAVDEGDGEITLVVSFEGAPPWREERVTVDYSILSGSATEGEDYTPVSGTLTFEPGEEPLYILVPVVQDSLAEPDETFFLRLSNARNARLPSSAQTTTVTIGDDEPRIIVSARGNEEITEGETASFAVIRTGDTTEELLVRLSLLVGSPGSDLSDLLDRSVTIPAGSDSVRLTHDTEDDDIDAAPFTIVAIVRDLADFNLASTYRAYIDNASITVLDNDLPTVTIEADLATILFGLDDAAFTLTREGDLSTTLTVSLDITQEGVLHGGGPLPDWASFATGPSTATFEAGSSTTNLSLATERQFSQGGQNFTMSRGLVNVALLPDSNDYITGDPASAALLLFANTGGFPVVYVEGPSPVAEGEDLVFTLHRTKGVGTSLTVPAILRERKFNSGLALAETYSLHETTFAVDSLTATVTVPTEANEINDGNREYRVNVKLGGSHYVGIGALVFGDLGYIWDNQSEQYPSFGSGWVRDDDIPTVWVTPETGEHFEDPEHTHPPFTFHRDSYESSLIYVFFAYRQLYRWPPPIPDSVYTSSATKRAAENAWLNPGVLSHTDRFSPGHVGPLGGESAIFLVPNYCGEDVLADCGLYPQYHVGSPSSGVIQVYNNFAGILVEPVEAEVEEGNDAVFQLTRYGGTPGSNGHPLTVWIEVTQDGEYIEGMPPQTVKFRGWPETSYAEADKTIFLSIPTTDDTTDERHGAITLRILPPEMIDVAEPSSYEVGVDDAVASFETGTVRVTDNDYYPPTISISDAWAGESDGQIDFFVNVAPNEREMSVEWNTVVETGVGVATAGTDYTAASGTLTFAVGETAKTITVAVLEDSQAESDETFEVVLSSQVNAVLGEDVGVGTIEDDDEGTVVTIHAQEPYGGTEEGQPAVFILQRVNGTSGIYVVLEISEQGTFLWKLLSTPVTAYIPAGVTELRVEITTWDDETVEANGSVTATVQPGDRYSPGIPDTATVNIRDNDRTISIAGAEAGEGRGSMTFAVTLSAPAENRVTVEAYTQSGKATASTAVTETSLGQDFVGRNQRLVFEPGETEKSFTVTLVDDAIDESAEEFTVRLSRPSWNVWLTEAAATATGTINDNDDPMNASIFREVRRVDEDRGRAVSFAVELTHSATVASERDTKLFWEVKPGTATDDLDFAKPYSSQRGTLAIPIGHLTSAIEVNLIDDALLEMELETFTVELVDAHRLVLPDEENRKKVEISIRDDERLSAAIAPREDSVIEGENAVFEVRLSGGVTMHKTVLEYTVTGDAEPGSDYTAPSGTLTIWSGRDTGTISIPTKDDKTPDPDETLVVTLTSGKSGTRNANIPDPTATATILDPGMIAVSVSPAEAEEGGTLSFTLTLSEASQSDVTVDWETADDPGAESAATADVDYVAAASTLIVPAGNTSAVITVRTIDDTRAAEGTETFRLDLTHARIDSGPDAEDLPLGVSTAVGTVLDNDIAPTRITLTATPYRVSEDAEATALTVTAALNGHRSLANDTRVLLALEDAAAVAGEDYEAATAWLTIPAGEMSAAAALTLDPVNDAVREGDETVSITGDADGLTVTKAQVTITDDDAAPTGVTLTLAPGVIGEGAGEMELTVTATLTGGDLRQVDTRVTLLVEGVSLTLDGATTVAATAADFAADPVTLTIPAGRMNGSALLAFTPVDDTLAEGDETAQVSGAAEGLTVTPANLTIEDNDQPPTRIVLSANPAEVTEGEGATILTVNAYLEGGSARISDTDVSLTVDGLTAETGVDFTAQEGVTLTIPAGRMSHTAGLTITPVDDNLAEGREEVSIGGSNAEPGLPVVGVKVDLTENDAEPTKISLSLNKDYVEENRGSQWLTVTASLDGSSRRTVDTSVRLRVASVTATTADYWALAGDLLIEAGEREGTADIVLAPTDDDIDEDDETLEVWGSTTRSRSAAQLQVSREQITIRDDDTAGVTVTPTELSVVEGLSGSYRVSLDTQPSADVKVTVSGASGTDITVSGSTLTNDALTFASDNWNTAQTVTVSVAQDNNVGDKADVTLTHTVTGAAEYATVTAGSVTVTITDDDTAGVTVSETALSIDEGASATYTVVLDTEPTGDVAVAMAGHADTDVSLDKISLAFTADNWDTAQRVTVSAARDEDAASDAAVTLTHTVTGTGEYSGVTAGSVKVTIVETDTSVLSVSDAQAAEDGGNVVFTVSISVASGEAVTVDYATSDGTATAGQDYTETTGTLTFPANSVTSKTISVSVTDDTVDEAEEDETFTLTLSNVQGASLTGGGSTLAATGTITDNDDPTVTASFVQTAYSVDEGGTVEVTLTLSKDPEREVTIRLVHGLHGGISDDDYSGVPANLVFQSGDTAKSFTFTAAADDIDDDGESVTLGFGTLPTGVSTESIVIATVTITDDDTAGVTISKTALEIDEGGSATYTVVLDTEPTGDVAVAMAGYSGTEITLDKTSLTFKASNWNRAQTVTVSAAEDDDAASDADVTLTHTANGGGYVDLQETVTVTIVEKDTAVLSVGDGQAVEDGGNVVFTVSISAATGEDVTVEYATSNGTATEGRDYTSTHGTLTFPANSVASRTISVPVTNDTADEAEEETFTLTLSNVHEASLAGGESTLEAIGTIIDNDDPWVTANFAQATYDVDEGRTVQVTLTLSKDPEREVTIQLVHGLHGGISDPDYSGVPASLVFESGDTEQSFIFTAAADDIDDDGESVALTFRTPMPTRVKAGATTTVTITDDDNPTVTASFAQTDYSVNEGGTVEVTVTLSADPEHEVVIPLTHDPQGDTGSADYSGVPASLVFQSGETEKSFTFRATADDIDDDGESVALAFGTLPTGVSTGSTGSATVTITDNDTAGVTISKTALSIDEGASATYTVVLDTKPTASVTVAIAGHAGTDVTPDKTSLTFTASNWNTAQAVTVSAAQDDDAASDTAVTLTHTVTGTGEYSGVTARSVKVTIVETDTSVLSVGDAQAVEEGGDAVFTVSISAATDEEVTVNYATSDGTARADQDYTETSGTLTFPANSVASQTISVPVTDDTVDEVEQTFILTLSNVQGASLAGGNSTLAATGTIIDNDHPTVRASFEETDYSVNEGGTVQVTMILSKDPEREVAIQLIHGLHGGISDDDYSGVPASVEFQSGETEQSFTFRATADDIDDDGESVALTFRTPMPAGVNAGATTTVSINDDDAPAVTANFVQATYDVAEGGTVEVTATLSAAPEREVTIPLTQGLRGTSGTDYSGVPASLVFRSGDTAKSFTFNAAGDDIDDDGESVVLGFGALPAGVSPGSTGSATVTIIDNDTAGVTVSETALEIDEGASATYTVVLDTEPTGDVAVAMAGHADTDVSLDKISLAFTADNWDTAQRVTVSAGEDDDALDEGEVSVTHTVTGTGEYSGVTAGSVTVTIVDTDTSVLSVGDAGAAEDDGNVVFTVSISAAKGEAVTVSYATSDGTAKAGRDYTETSGTLTFPANSVASKTVSVPVTDDAADEAEEETFTLTLSNVQGASLAGGRSTLEATGTITDDDDPTVTARFAQRTYSVDEGGTVQVTMTLSADPEREVSIRLVHGRNGGISDADYSGVPASVEFQSGETEQSFTFRATADDIDDDGESVALTFRTPMPAGVNAGATTTVSINDDDTVGVTVTVTPTTLTVDEGGSADYSLVLNAQPSGDVTVGVNLPTGNDLSASPVLLTFTASNWNTAQTVTVSAAEDDDAIADRAVDIGHTVSGLGDAEGPSVRVTIRGNDAPGLTIAPTELTIGEGETGQYTVVLDSEPSNNVTVEIGWLSGTDVSVSPASPLTFTIVNWSEAQAVTVSAAEDDDTDTDPEVTLTHTVTGGDYQGHNAAGVTVTITENDQKDTSVLSVGDVRAAEDDGNVVFTVSISAAKGEAVTVSYATSDGTAKAGRDYTETSGTLTFPANSAASQTVSVPVTDDAADEAEEETFTLTLSNAQGASLAGGGSTLEVTGTITDDDDPTVTASFAQRTYSVDEGGTVQVTMTLSADPEREVTIRLIHGLHDGISDADYSGVPASLVFQSGETEQSFTFTAADDDIDDDGESVALTFRTPMPAGVTAGTTTTVAITDDDERGVAISKTALEIDEGGSGTYTVRLDTEPTAGVTITIAGHSATDITLSGATLTDDTLTFTADNWNTAQTVTVSAEEDDDTDADPAVTLTHTVAGGDYQGQRAVGVTVTITENDQVEPPTPQPAVTVSFEKDYHNLSEGASGGAGVGLLLSAALEGDVTIPIGVLPQSTASWEDYSGVPNGITFAAGETYTYFRVHPVADTVEEEDEQVWLGLGSLPDGVSAGNYSQTYVRIFDAAHVSFGSSSYVATEGRGDAVVTVRLNKPLPHDVSIPLTAEGSSGATSDDWSGVPQKLTFASDDTEKTFTVVAVDDTVEDDGEMVTLGFGALSDRLIAVSPATTVITLMNMEDDPDAADSPVPASPHCQGTTAAVGSVYTGTIKTAGETGWWTVELDPRKSYTIHTRGADIEGGGTLPHAETLQFSRSDGGFFTAYRHSTAVGFPASLLAKFDIWLTKPGIYCFEVGTRANEPGTYNLEVESHGYNHNYDVPADTSTKKTIATPVTRILDGGFLGDHGGSEPDEDWFRAPLEGGVAYRILLSADTHEEERHQLKRPKLVGIHHPNGTAIDGTASTGTGQSVSVDFTPPRSGDYYIAVGSNSGDATGMFVLCARVIAQGDADNCGGRGNSHSGYAPPRAPRNLRASQGNSQELDVSWERASSSSGPGKDTQTYGYKVQWRRASDSWDDGDEVTVSHRVPGASYTITGLDNGVAYAVRVRAFNFMGVGDASEEVSGSPEQGQGTGLQAYNSPATGGPGIGGTPRVGEILAATTEGISDGDGLTGAVFNYQWIRHDFGTGTDTDIAGATGTSYTVTSHDAGHGIKVRVSFTDDAGHEELLTSYAVAAAAPPPPLTADFPQSPYQSLSHRGADDRPQVIVGFSRAVAAFANTTPSVSVTGGTVYSVLTHEENGLEHAWVFFLDPTGTDDIQFSLLNGQSCEAGGVCAADGTTLSVAPGTRTIPGPEEEEDETEPQEQEPAGPPPAPQNLTAVLNKNGSVTLIWDASDDDSVTGYQVLRRRPTMDEDALQVHVEDTGSTATTYTDSDVTEGVRHVYLLKAINAAGLSERSNYVNVDPPEREASAPATGAPVISGTAQVDETLTADISGVADEDGLTNASYSYQWIAGGSDIDGASDSTYTLVAADEGRTIKVQVSFTDDANNLETLTSAATAAVAARPNSPATGAATISGTAQVNETLTADISGIADEDGLADVSYSYQWVAGGSDIDGATGSTYTLTASEQGQTIQVRVSFTDDRNNAETLTSETIRAVAAADNRPATGLPTIGGMVQVDQTLTANTTDIADADGLDDVSYSYQWIRSDGNTDIAGETDSTYTLVSADEGKTIKVKVSFSDDANNLETLTSEATATVAAKPNTAPTGLPTIGGTVQVGETLTASTSDIEDQDGLDNATFSYQWLADDSAITDATGSAYTLVPADEGRTIKVRVSFTDNGDNEETLTSAATAAVAARPNSPATGAPTISGAAQVNETLTADISGISDKDGLADVSYSYQWVAGGLDIDGATDSTYTLTASEQGQTVQVRVSFTDDRNNAETLTSETTTAVAAADNRPATGLPTIVGTVQVEETLTADTSGIADADGLTNVSFSYQWIRSDGNTDIAGETDSTYTLVSADVGKAIKVKVSFSDDANNLETLTSEATATVAAKPNTAPTGLPTIGGTAQVGETLTASTSDIEDQDGLENATFSYQWLTDDSAITDATGSAYILVPADQGRTIKVRVSFIDNADSEETLTSAATAAVAARPNSPATGAPAISGAAQVGETLTADTSDISDGDGLDNATFSYQWLADDSAITDATGSAYILVPADQGRTIKVRVSFIDNADSEETLTSAATAAVAARPNSPATGAPTISGTAQVGEKLTASTSEIEDADGLTGAAFSYQWISSDTKIAGATEPTYTLAAADQGRTVKVRVSFTDDEGNAESLTSAATDMVEAAPVTTPLTASFQNVPASHDGESGFTFRLTFSEEVDSLSFQTLRGEALEVTGGEVLKAKRHTKGSNREWDITVEPDSDGKVAIRLPKTMDCDASGAICTADRRPLSTALSATVAGP